MQNKLSKEGHQETASTLEQTVDSSLDVKHPLQSSWTLWYFEQRDNKSWEDSQYEVFTFDTVEDFWSLFNHICQPSEIKNGADYSLFKTGIRPQWEDKENKNGGRWMMTLTRVQRQVEFDRYWMDALLSVIGETADSSKEICGVVANNRNRGDKISIWTRGSDRSVVEIGRKLKLDMDLPDDVSMQFHTHADSSNKSSSIVRARFKI